MNNQSVAMTLSIIGILLFIAPSFDVIPNKYGEFFGIAFMLFAGAAWGGFYSKNKKSKSESGD